MFSRAANPLRTPLTKPSPSRSRVAVRATAKLAPGTPVKVSKSVQVYHVPKSKGEATDLVGMSGVIDSRADEHEGKATSATLAVRVKLEVPDGSGKTFIAHLDESEVEVA
jgi:hypothetical protein